MYSYFRGGLHTASIKRLCSIRRGLAAPARSFLRFDLDPALRIELPPDSGELPDGFLVGQSVHLIALEGRSAND